jgi:predicted phosphate transport protein (TIGR00153 family)
MVSILKKAKGIEGNIEKFLKNIEMSTSHFELGLKEYFEGKTDNFSDRCSRIQKLESECDGLRFDIKFTLYSDLLIPDARGDVLGLIENLDNVIDLAEKVFVQFSLEKPIIYPFLKDDFITVTEASAKAVHMLIPAVRAFFHDPGKVADLVTQVHFWEHEADSAEYRIKEKAFASEEIEPFSRKVHMRHFAEKISLLADEAEAVAERLEVYAIKRAF